MGYDALSPIAPARLKALLLPVGRIKRSRFQAFLQRLESEDIVRLGDVSPDARPNRNMFSPLAFPAGRVLFDLSTSVVPQSYLNLSPFEHFREPVAIIGIADGSDGTLYQHKDVSGESTQNGAESTTDNAQEPIEGLKADLETLKEQHPQALVHHLLMFDMVSDIKLPDGIVAVPSPTKSKTTTMKTIMCDLTSQILGELAEYARYVQGLSYLESPKPLEEEVISQHPGLSRSANGSPQPSPGLRRAPTTEERVSQRMMTPSPPIQKSTQITGASGKFVATRIAGTPAALEESQRPSSMNRTSVIRSSASEGNSVEHSRERIPVQGFGPSSSGEKARSQNKGRIGIVVGSLYLQVGRWSDALKELTESATIARTNSDYLWHAKALENILVCLLAMGWAGMDFQIPRICYPVGERASISAKSSVLNGSAGTSEAGDTGSVNRLASLQNLSNLLPELTNHILNLYTRAANITDESLPQLAFSETVIRFSNLLACCHIRDGQIDDQLLEHLVRNGQLTQKENSGPTRGGAYLRKSELTSRLLRALPTSTEAMLSHGELSPILVAMASILSQLGLHRKKVFVLRELLSVLIPALVQARKVGAAEMGIHPAAGLSSIEGVGLVLKSTGQHSSTLHRGLDTFIRLMSDVYGTVELESPDSEKLGPDAAIANGAETTTIQDSNEAILARTFKNIQLRRYGMLVLKVDFLIACISFCEALPDFLGVLQYTVELLQTCSPGFPLPPDGRGTQYLPRDEQMRLITNIRRTVSAGTKLGIENLEAEYWDDFLVRGVDVLDWAQQKKLIAHSKNELLTIEASQDPSRKNPFIYNPFAKTASTAAADHVIVAEEQAAFKIELQNPFEFDLEIERIALETEGVQFESSPLSIFIPPYCIHVTTLLGTAKESGPLKVTGCVIKVKDCRERRFPIFKGAWMPKDDVKMKANGLASKHHLVERPLSTSSSTSQKPFPGPRVGPSAETLIAKVISAQPNLVVQSSSLPQSAIMILEGETKSFSITLKNASRTTAVDLLLFTFQDSTTSKLQSAMSNKDISPADLYELELQLSKKALRWRRDDGEQEYFIGPGETTTMIVEIFGIPGLTNAAIQLDYSFLGAPKSEVKDKFYTRQLTIPLTVTVNASVEVVKWDILPFSGDFAWSNQRKQQQLSNGALAAGSESSQPRSRAVSGSSRKVEMSQEKNQFQSLLDRLGLRNHGDDHCLLLLDLRNAWPSPLLVSIQVRDTTSLSQSPGGSDPWRRAYTVHETLQPGHISRIVLLLPRIFLSNPHAMIPSLNPANQRQYVVSSTKIPVDQELANRESFWSRAELFKHIRGSWSEDSTTREGVIELRGIRLNPRMLDALRVEDVDISFHLASSSPTHDGDHNSEVHQTGRSSFTVQTHAFLSLTTCIYNRSPRPILPLLRLQPSLRNQPTPIALDLSKRLAWTGMLQRALPVLGSGENMKVMLGVCAMCRGEFDIGASVEEVRVMKSGPDEGQKSSAKEDFDILAQHEKDKKRRIWHAKEGCVIVAKDSEHEGELEEDE